MTGRSGRFTFGGVHARPLRLGGFRIDPVKLDLLLAAALAIGSELEVWFGSVTGRERLVVAIAGPLMAATVAIRRRFPAAAGIAAALIADVVAIGWKPPNTVSFGIAWFCSIYALTVWTSTRLFVIGATVLALPTFVAVAIGGGPRGGVSFTVVTLVVMVLVRRVVGDRERREDRRARTRSRRAGGGRRGAGTDRPRAARRDRPSRLDDRPPSRRRAAGARRREHLDARGAGNGRANRPKCADGDASSTRHAPCRDERATHASAQARPTFRSWSPSSGQPGFPSISRSKASRASSRSGSSSPPTGSSKRR